MATVEQVKVDVIEAFKEVHGIDVVNAWPIGPRAWQGVDEYGQVYTLRW